MGINVTEALVGGYIAGWDAVEIRGLFGQVKGLVVWPYTKPISEGQFWPGVSLADLARSGIEVLYTSGRR